MASQERPKRRSGTESSQRDLLIDQVRKGQLLPSDAEEKAKQLGIGPLASHPDPALFDPMQEDQWSLPMTIAWIVWRSPDAVREQWDAYRIDAWWWLACRWSEGPNGPTYEGFDLHRYPTANWSLLRMNENYPQERSREFPFRPRSPRDAKDELWKACSEGLIEAKAVDLVTRQRVSIPAREWVNFEIFTEIGWDELRTSVQSRSGYEHIEFSSAAIVHAWPAQSMPTERLPDLMPPHGPGYMPLSAAAQWIASKGGTSNVASSDVAAWDNAYRALLDRISSGEVATTGTHQARSQRADPALFAGIRIFHCFGSEELDAGFATELYLLATSFVDVEQWHGGFNDCLRNRWADVWTKLMVDKADVATLWPVPKAAAQRGPGRPSDRELILDELRRRCAAGQMLPRIAAESRALAEWLSEQSGAVLTSAGTIENIIRDDHKRCRKAHETK